MYRCRGLAGSCGFRSLPGVFLSKWPLPPGATPPLSPPRQGMVSFPEDALVLAAGRSQKRRPWRGAPLCSHELCQAPAGQKLQRCGPRSPVALGSPSTLRCFWSRLPGRSVCLRSFCVSLSMSVFTSRRQRVFVPPSVRVPCCVVLFVIVPTLLSGWFCVSEKDCGDGSDEKNCPKPTG